MIIGISEITLNRTARGREKGHKIKSGGACVRKITRMKVTINMKIGLKRRQVHVGEMKWITGSKE